MAATMASIQVLYCPRVSDAASGSRHCQYSTVGVQTRTQSHSPLPTRLDYDHGMTVGAWSGSSPQNPLSRGHSPRMLLPCRPATTRVASRSPRYDAASSSLGQQSIVPPVRGSRCSLRRREPSPLRCRDTRWTRSVPTPANPGVQDRSGPAAAAQCLHPQVRTQEQPRSHSQPHLCPGFSNLWGADLTYVVDGLRARRVRDRCLGASNVNRRVE